MTPNTLQADVYDRLSNKDLDRLVEGASLFNESRFDQFIQTTFNNPSWWPNWRSWQNSFKMAVTGAEDSKQHEPLSLNLPVPPEEPTSLWETAHHLLEEGTFVESVSAARIRLMLAQGRVIRKLMTSKDQ